MRLIILWVINFLQIVLIAYQTKNITQNRYKIAMVTQFILSIIQVTFVYIAISESMIPASVIMGTSGAAGVIVGMILFKFF